MSDTATQDYTPGDANMTDENGNAVYAAPPDTSGADGPRDGLDDAERRRIADADKPIEHDPIGQALVSLPFGLAEGAYEGVTVGATLAKEAVAAGVEWVGDKLFDHSDSDESSSHDGDGAGGAGGGDGSGAEGSDGGTDQAPAASYSSSDAGADDSDEY